MGLGIMVWFGYICELHELKDLTHHMGDEIHNTLGRKRCIIPSEKVPPYV